MQLFRMLGLLMLMFLLRDADSMCPIETNPPSAVEEYGGELVVNCTTREEYDIILWRVGNKDVEEEEEKEFVSHNLQLTDWNMKAECIIKLNDTHECSKDVDLTIYKNPEVVLSVQNVQDLGEETLYELQCDILNVAPVQNLTVKWYTNNEVNKTDSFSNTTRTPVNESSTLTLGVRREDSVVQVRCEAQLDLESQGRPLPVISQTYNVSAHTAEPTCSTVVIVDPAVIIGEYGKHLDVNCTSDEENHKGIFWRVGDKDSPKEEMKIFDSQNLPLTDWNMKAECIVQLDDTHECSKDVDLTIYKNPEVVLSVQNVQDLGEETLYELQCDILNVAPVQNLTVKWYTNNEVNKTDSFSDTTRTPVNESSTLTLGVTREDSVVQVRCEAQLDLEPHGRPLPVISQTRNVSSPFAQRACSTVVIVDPAVIIGEYGKHLDVNCTSGEEYHKGIFWRVGDKDSPKEDKKMFVSQNLPLTDWNMKAECIVQLGVTRECSKDVEINIYKNPEVVLSVQNVQNLGEETLYELQCDILNVAPVQHLTVKWYTNNEINKTDSFSDTTRTPVNESSTLTLGVRREDSVVQVRCEAQLDLEPHGRPLPVISQTRNVSSPYATELKMAPPSAPVAETGCPVTLSPPEIAVKFGDPLSVNCSTSGADGLGWEATVAGTGLEAVTVLTWKVEKLEAWNVLSSCYTYLNDRHCEKNLSITVYQTPETVSVLDGGPMVEGKEYQLVCDVDNVAPVQKLKVKWYQGHKIKLEDTFSGDTTLTPVNVTSKLTINPTKEDNGTLFRCQAELHLGPSGPGFLPNTTSAPYTAVVHYKPTIKDCRLDHSGVEHNFSLDMLTCEADGNPPPEIKWYYKDKVKNSSAPLSRTDSGEYRAEFKNSIGMISTTVHIMVEYGPSFACHESYDVKENGMLQCEPEGVPTPTLTWFKDGKEMVPPQRWTKQDSGEYLIKASNTQGSANHKLRVNVLYAPEFKEGNYNIEFSQGQNVTLSCSAEGNPPPEIQWSHASTGDSEPTVWRQNTITITGATSTDGGVYICVATNEIGNVTRSVRLTMKGEPRKFPVAVLWVLIVVMIILLILMIAAFFCSTKKKHGQYSFVHSSDVVMTTLTTGENS